MKVLISFCFVVEELGISIIATPDLLIGTPSITECAPDYSSQGTFDLTFYNIKPNIKKEFYDKRNVLTPLNLKMKKIKF